MTTSTTGAGTSRLAESVDALRPCELEAAAAAGSYDDRGVELGQLVAVAVVYVVGEAVARRAGARRLARPAAALLDGGASLPRRWCR